MLIYAEIGIYRRRQIAGVHLITFHSQKFGIFLRRLLLIFFCIFRCDLSLEFVVKSKDGIANALEDCEVSW